MEGGRGVVHWEQAVHLSSEDGDTWSGGGGRGITTATIDRASLFPLPFFKGSIRALLFHPTATFRGDLTA